MKGREGWVMVKEVGEAGGVRESEDEEQEERR